MSDDEEQSGDLENPHPKLYGVRVTDASAALGAVAVSGLYIAAREDLLEATAVELYVAVAVTVVTPLALGLAPDTDSGGGARKLYEAAVWLQPPAAAAALVALVQSVSTPYSTAATAPWIAFTLTAAVYGGMRFMSRGTLEPASLTGDAALLYLPVGSVFLGLHRADVTLGFEPVIVLLTSVHFHYAAFAMLTVFSTTHHTIQHETPRPRSKATALAEAALLASVAGIAAVAIGIATLPLVELAAVAFLAFAVSSYVVYAATADLPHLLRPAAAVLKIAFLALLPSMALALAYAYSVYPATPTIVDVGFMLRTHGAANAFAFTLPALLTLRYVGDT